MATPQDDEKGREQSSHGIKRVSSVFTQKHNEIMVGEARKMWARRCSFNDKVTKVSQSRTKHGKNRKEERDRK